MKEFWRNLIMCSVLAMTLAGSTLTVSGCKEDSPIENAAEEAGDAIEDAGEAIQDAADDVADEVEDEM